RRGLRPVRAAARAGAVLAGGGPAAFPGPAGCAHRHHAAGHPHPVLAGGAARFAAGPGGAAVPEDRAEAHGAYHARTGAQGHPWPAAFSPRATRRPAAALPATTRLT